MAETAPLYHLILMLSAGADEDRRAKILQDVGSAISKAGGSVERNDDWGQRPMAYQIRHQPEAEYHLLQFTAPPTLIEDLSHTLRITDGVLRNRVIKVRPGTPDAPSSAPPVVASAAPAASAAQAASAGPPASPAPSREPEAPSAEAASPEPEAPSAEPEAASAEPDAPTAEPDSES